MALLRKNNSQYGDTKHKWRTLPPLLLLLPFVHFSIGQFTEPEYTTDPYVMTVKTPQYTELPGGFVTDGQMLWSVGKSPYLLREDLVIERDGELVVEPGVEVRFGPMVGITVRGKITAIVSNFHLTIFALDSDANFQLEIFRRDST